MRFPRAVLKIPKQKTRRKTKKVEPVISKFLNIFKWKQLIEWTIILRIKKEVIINGSHLSSSKGGTTTPSLEFDLINLNCAIFFSFSKFELTLKMKTSAFIIFLSKLAPFHSQVQ